MVKDESAHSLSGCGELGLSRRDIGIGAQWIRPKPGDNLLLLAWAHEFTTSGARKIPSNGFVLQAQADLPNGVGNGRLSRSKFADQTKVHVQDISRVKLAEQVLSPSLCGQQSEFIETLGTLCETPLW